MIIGQEQLNFSPQNLVAQLSSLDPHEELPLATWKNEPNNIKKGNYYDQQITSSTYYDVLVGTESKNNGRAKKNLSFFFPPSPYLFHIFCQQWQVVTANFGNKVMIQ